MTFEAYKELMYHSNMCSSRYRDHILDIDPAIKQSIPSDVQWKKNRIQFTDTFQSDASGISLPTTVH